jgi:hypothetical protein
MDRIASEQSSTDMINMAHIRVAGIGGLGMVVVSALVALYIPAVGLSLAAGFALGTLLAIVLIVRRRKSGPMPSSGKRPGASNVLSIDAREPSREGPAGPGPDSSRTLRASSVHT